MEIIHNNIPQYHNATLNPDKLPSTV
jgi:hypothetical protein